jgi:hypothetical protein
MCRIRARLRTISDGFALGGVSTLVVDRVAAKLANHPRVLATGSALQLDAGHLAKHEQRLTNRPRCSLHEYVLSSLH